MAVLCGCSTHGQQIKVRKPLLHSECRGEGARHPRISNNDSYKSNPREGCTEWSSSTHHCPSSCHHHCHHLRDFRYDRWYHTTFRLSVIHDSLPHHIYYDHHCVVIMTPPQVRSERCAARIDARVGWAVGRFLWSGATIGSGSMP